MNVLSLFDGMSCGRVALERAGLSVNRYLSSEIKPSAIKVANFNYPSDADQRLGDITNIDPSDLPKIDLLIGGSPCQDFSSANKTRLGVQGGKSRLFFEYVRMLKGCNPKFFLLENVLMKKEHEDFVSRTLGVRPISLNSGLVAPCLRSRLYWTNIPTTLPLVDKNLCLNNFLVGGGYSDRRKARALLVSDSRPLRTPVKMAHRYFGTGFTTLIFKSRDHFHGVREHYYRNFKGMSGKEITEKMPGMDLSIYDGVRYMTKRERESCQTVPSGYTDTLTENEAADVLGDGWTIDIISHIFKGLS